VPGVEQWLEWPQHQRLVKQMGPMQAQAWCLLLHLLLLRLWPMGGQLRHQAAWLPAWLLALLPSRPSRASQQVEVWVQVQGLQGSGGSQGHLGPQCGVRGVGLSLLGHLLWPHLLDEACPFPRFLSLNNPCLQVLPPSRYPPPSSALKT
jgi:hypothetical protein